MRKGKRTFNGARRLGLPICIICMIWTFTIFGQTQIGTPIAGEAAGDRFGTSVSMNALGNIIAIGAHLNDGGGLNAGHARVYQNNAGVWIQIGTDIDAEGQQEFFGGSISLNTTGSIVAVGGYGYDPLHKPESSTEWFGVVRVFENINGVWTQIGANITGITIDDHLGRAVDLNADGTIVAISASGDAYVSIYENLGGTWTQIGSNIINAVHETNSAISINEAGDIIAIGISPGNGAVKIYQNNAGTWTQVGSDIIGEASGDQFGTSVSLNATGDIVAIGGRLNDGAGADAGHVRVYQNIAGTWTQIGADIDGEAAGDFFGASVSINDAGDVLVVGATTNDGNGTQSGHVRVYQNLSGVWTQLATDIDGAVAGDQFGTSVAINGTGSVMVAGAINNDDNGTESGHARVFEFKSHIPLKSQAFLSGPFNTGTNLMNDDLRVAGTLPTLSPYGDGATANASVFTTSGNNAIVDWVLVELRDKNDITTVLETKGALLQRDGDIVDVDGVSDLNILAKRDNYFVSVTHRNHINIVTDVTHDLGGVNPSIDFRTASNLRGAANAVVELTTGVFGLLAGEVNGDGQIQTTDYGALSTLIGQAGYRAEDVNMDNQVQTIDISKLIAAFGSGIQF